MMAEVGGTMKVMGSKMATPFTDPRPGMAPTNSPATTPSTIMNRLISSKLVTKPSIKCQNVSICLFLGLSQ